ncbi:MAG: hypothetical protein R3F17_13775 [Planctomycetota bacterium]
MGPDPLGAPERHPLWPRTAARRVRSSYLLDITRVDPLTYDLLFERFLNSSRVSMPDIDIDFCKDRPRTGDRIHLAEVWAGQRHADRDLRTMASRTVIRDVGRVLDVPLREVDKIAKKISPDRAVPSSARPWRPTRNCRSSGNESELYCQLLRLLGVAQLAWRATSRLHAPAW